ncbi:cytochrome p450 monooxygenase [Grosmannia clavigera kw1407]|uniref:Cytochrome p450 monooxygenase n=1 Tax=Grosmannia clavigera (strain kw1407 / UAMH 11150) TaxID=655863 RepID=F0X909_GROCL|nr:cytochrome p450 monooxygenase [Grosmannia clavigera kw1407]EFX05467.1 cytochrome p450 monooxygenase [Grosmannia clavigera kw1407]
MSSIASSQDGAVLRLASWISDQLSASRIAAVGAVLFLTTFLIGCTRQPRYPKSLPRMGYGDGPLATLRNWVAYTFHFHEWTEEGYRKHSKHGRTFIVSSGPSLPQEMVVPRSQTAWMLDLPDNILSTDEAHDVVLHSKYNLLLGVNSSHQHHDGSFHNRIIHRNLARHLPGLLPAIEQEVAAAVDCAFGTGSDGETGDWHTVNLWDAWLAMVSRVTNRMLVGENVCRGPHLLQHMIRFADVVVANSFVLGMFPKLLHPLVGRLLCLSNWRHWRAAHKMLEPLIQDRLRQLAAGDEAVSEDYITWHIRTAMAEGRVEELTPAAVSRSLMPLEFAAIHTTVLTGHSLLLDLLSSDPSRGFIDAIRNEVGVVQSADAPWTKAQLGRLWRTDSAIRESMRISNFATSLTKRKVVAPGGLTNVAEGWHAPYGSFLVLNLSDMHHDQDLYVDPDYYDAFRYSRMREEATAGPAVDGGPARGSQLGMVTTSDRHLAFGHGRHACPGRFFVAHELKMILAYLLANYDVKPLAERPKPRWIGQTIIPPLDAKIEVRRRTPV